MRLVLLAAAMLLATPALAASGPPRGDAGELAQSLPSPEEVEAAGAMAEAGTDALMNVPVGQYEEALAPWRDYPPGHRDETLGDITQRHDPQFNDKVHRYVGKMTRRVNQMNATFAAAAPVVDRELDLLRQQYKRLKRELQRRYRN